MKKFLIAAGLALTSMTMHGINVNKIDPAFWFTGMKNTELQLMIYGQNIGNSELAVDYPGVKIERVIPLESKNYMLVYLNLSSDVKPGKMKLTFKEGHKKLTKEYVLCEKSRVSHTGFDASDVLYMLMPDRFANGNPANDQIKGMYPYTMNRKEPSLRHGGDLAGIKNHLDYFNELGVTALWFTPVLENNTPDNPEYKSSTYHGYETTDYYKVDPRFGTNEEYRQLISDCHQRGLKVVMDMIFNHCGGKHPWILDRPAKDWFNYPAGESNFMQTSYKLTPQVDLYASDWDYKEMGEGWFVRTMPDLNQKNEHVAKYLIQNSLWWIEYGGIDGIRMDTYPYADYDMMSEWLKELFAEYPDFNVVGETWNTETAYTASWQAGSKLPPHGKDSHLKTVMDFSFFDKMNQAKKEDTDAWWNGLNRIYGNFVYDYLYPDPLHVMAFLENHDTDRFLGNSQDVPALKQALALLLTTRRIPQLYYGTEVLMNGTKEKTDGDVRKDFPGGWKEDAQNAFTKEGRTAVQNDMFDFCSKLLHWRKGNDIIAKGDMKQFIPFNGVYVYSRNYQGKEVVIILNGTNKSAEIPMNRYAEIFSSSKQGKDIISGKTVDFSKETLKLQPKESLILEM